MKHRQASNLLNTRFARFSWAVLGYNVLVVLWGAFVRATGSGAGCGSHWPSCNGEVIPRSMAAETIIEFTHRLTSGAAFLLVLAMLVWALRAYPKGHRVRAASGAAMLFIISESLVGAGLVLFEWVGQDTSTARVLVMGIHLLNTFLLLAAIALAGWWAAGGAPLRLSDQPARVKWQLGVGIAGVLLLSMAGAVTALGDTLFPAATLMEGVRQDFSPAAHFTIRLRVWHPLIAGLVGLYLFWLTASLSRGDARLRRFALTLAGLYGAQLAAGALNLLLQAPVWMQILHLLLADAVWIMLILLAAQRFCGAADGADEVNR